MRRVKQTTLVPAAPVPATLVPATLVLATLVLATLVLVGGAARGDQSNARLDDLFMRLGEAESLAEAQGVERRIWRIWHAHDDERVAAAMADGQAALADDDRKGALAAFDHAVKLAPNFAEAWNARATVNFLMGNYRRSLADIRRVLALEPRHFGALAGRGLCWLALERPGRALAAFEASLDLHPHQPGTRARARQVRKRLQDSAI